MSKSTRFMFAAITGIAIVSAGTPAFAQSDANSGRPMVGGGMMDQRSMGPGTMGPGSMGPSTMGPYMMGPGMMGPGMMGGMMSSGAQITLPALPPGNEALQFRMHAEMMQKIGEIAAGYADRINTGK